MKSLRARHAEAFTGRGNGADHGAPGVAARTTTAGSR